MSSVVTAPEGLPSRPDRAAPESQRRGGGLSRDFLLGLVGATALAAIGFVAAGGNTLAPNTWVQVGLLVFAAAAGVVAVLVGARDRLWGAASLLGFAALAALAYASIGWSVEPAKSWLEANRTLSYFAAFATALLLARLVPGAWRALIGAVATAATAICAYALLAKVFPGTLDLNELVGRLRVPLDYWNAMGLIAAMGLPACAWAGSRRDGAPLLRALSVPAIAILVAALILSLSRGSMIVAVIGLAVWFALAPLRLRSALVLAVGAAAGTAIGAWGSVHRGISADNVTAATRISAGHSFGIVVAIALVLAAVAGFGAIRALDRVELPALARRRVGTLLIGLVALAPIGGMAALAASHRGFSGEVSHLWNRLTSTSGGIGNQPGRLAHLSNSRPHYWSIAFKIGAHHPLAGVGALGFGTAQLRYQIGPPWALQLENVVHAHGYVMETFADFGAIGLAVSLVLFLGWAFATGRTLGFAWPGRDESVSRAPPGAEVSAERTGLFALLAIVVIFGLHSLIDWTWFIPGTAVIALVCAGWLAGRGPLLRPVGRLPRRRVLSRSPGAVAGIVSITVVTLIAVWFVVQPLRSANSYSAAYSAALRGQGGAAIAAARSSASEYPVSIQPLFLLSKLYGELGIPAAARSELVEAVHRQPANPQTWEQLGCYDLGRHQSSLASAELQRGLALEPAMTQIVSDPAGFCAAVSG